MNRLLLVLFVAGLMGCQPQTDDLVEFFSQVEQNNPAPVDPYPEFKKAPFFAYAEQSYRSPFHRPETLRTDRLSIQKANCTQPDVRREKHPLENYGTDALIITGFFTSHKKHWVLFQTNDGRLFRATKGDYLGLFFGRITSIADGVVLVTEMLPDGAGCWQKKQNSLTMPGKTGEQNNV